ncbi:MAG: LacI family transcriptional regulator [Clostridia bacterium]|nr:LacI family transcriptional regulator [Clostridia bacterium]
MVSIKDVAEHAGVAISTVSKVLNNYPYVSEQTKNKVRESIHALNYVPNTIAAALSSKQVGRAAIIISLNMQTQAIDEITMQYLSGALHQAQLLNIEIITIFFSMISHLTPEEITRYLQSQGITGILICGITKESKNLHQLIESRVFKCVVIDAPFTNESTSSVGIDHEQAQYDVAKKTIVENSCKRILYIAGKRNGYVTDERIKGIKRLAQDLKLTVLLRDGAFSEKTAREITFKYAKNKDAVVCASDLMAIGAMNALTEMDIFRPVCGFDGIILMGYVGKQMNTISQNFYRVAAEAMNELDRLYHEENGQRVILDYEIVRMQYLEIIR